MSLVENEQPRRRRGCWCMLLISTLVVVLGGGVTGSLLYLAGKPSSIEVSIPELQPVAANQSFTVEVTIENVSLDPVTINSIGLDTSLLDGITVLQIEPAYRSAKDKSYPLYGDWREYTLNKSLPGGDKLTVILTLQANQPGTYSGDVMVWIKSRLLGMSVARAGRASLKIEVR
jgi:hypothetical protein